MGREEKQWGSGDLLTVQLLLFARPRERFGLRFSRISTLVNYSSLFLNNFKLIPSPFYLGWLAKHTDA